MDSRNFDAVPDTGFYTFIADPHDQYIPGSRQVEVLELLAAHRQQLPQPSLTHMLTEDDNTIN